MIFVVVMILLSSFSRSRSFSLHSSCNHVKKQLFSAPRTFIPTETLYVFDGTAMLYNSFFSKFHSNSTTQLPHEISSSLTNMMKQSNFGSENIEFLNSYDGAACLGMCDILSRFVKQFNPKYIAVAFDCRKKNFRHDDLSSYKANRPPPPSGIVPQFYLAPVLLDALGCCCFEQPGYEADDIMATLGHWARQRGLNVVHISPDKDMLQLIQTGVHVYRPQRGSFYTEEDLLSQYGVSPSRWTEYQALLGDVADNIPGVPGIGVKTAVALLNRFSCLEDMCTALCIPENEASIPSIDPQLSGTLQVEPPGLQVLTEALRGVRSSPRKIWNGLQTISKERLLLYRNLVTLRVDVPIEGFHGGEFSNSNPVTEQNDDKTSTNQCQLHFSPSKDSSRSVPAHSEKEDSSSSSFLVSQLGEYRALACRRYLVEGKPVTSATMRFRGEKQYCDSMFQTLGPSFVKALNTFRFNYGFLDMD